MPGATPSDLFFEITSALGIRKNAVTQAERKLQLAAAPVYMFLFAWQSRGFGGKYKAFHAADVPFVFDTLDRTPALADGDARAAALARTMSQAWLAFARGGDPNHAGLPRWAPYSLAERATMVFDNECRAANDPDRDQRLAIAQAAAGPLS
jgi:para-nitrobenzyl esterase